MHDDGGGGVGDCGNGNFNLIVGNSVYEDVNIIHVIQDSGQWLSTVITFIYTQRTFLAKHNLEEE